MDLDIDQSWNYKQAVIHLQTLKLQYEEVLASFSYWEIKEKNNFMYSIRDHIYSLNILEWQKDRIWNCLNGNDNLSNIIRSAFRHK